MNSCFGWESVVITTVKVPRYTNHQKKGVIEHTTN